MDDDDLASTELMVLQSMYDSDELTDVSITQKSISFKLSFNCVADDISALVTMNCSIPRTVYGIEFVPCKSLFSVNCPALRSTQLDDLLATVRRTVDSDCEGDESSMKIVAAIDIVKESIIPVLNTSRNLREESSGTAVIEDEGMRCELVGDWFAAETVINMKSVFQGFVCRVRNISRVTDSHIQKLISDFIAENPKVGRSTHNMYAWWGGHGDDGESGAGSVLSELLAQKNFDSQNHNVLLVVSRWSSGIKLGPARFRNIKEAGAMALDNLLKKTVGAVMLPSSVDGGVLINVCVKANAPRSEVGKINDDGYLSVDVRALPENNKANERCAKVLASFFGVLRNDIKVVKGEFSGKAKALQINAKVDVVRDKLISCL